MGQRNVLLQDRPRKDVKSTKELVRSNSSLENLAVDSPLQVLLSAHVSSTAEHV